MKQPIHAELIIKPYLNKDVKINSDNLWSQFYANHNYLAVGQQICALDLVIIDIVKQ